MNYKIRSIHPVTRKAIEMNTALDQKYSPTSEDNSCNNIIIGEAFKMEIEVVVDEIPVYLTFLCGDIRGIQLEHADENYRMLEAYEDLPLEDIKEALEYDFPTTINHFEYLEEAEKATTYLHRNDIAAVQSGVKVYLSFQGDILIYLAKRDIKYFSGLEDDFQLEKM